MSILKNVIDILGVVEAAKVCGVSPRAVYKWVSAGRLPRTEYTGETKHAENLAAAAGVEITAKEILEDAKPTAA